MSIDEQLIGALHLSSGGAGEDLAAAHRAFQASTLTALLDGAYEGDVSFAELARRGDFGIGTLNGCDGEMIALDGRFLRADETGAVSEVPPEARTPFAVLTFFEARHRLELDGGASFDGICAAIDAHLGEGSEAIVHAVRVEGRFAALRCRSVPRQEPPYRPLAEVLAEQNLFEFCDERGTLVGFRFPNLGLGIGVPGYHLHFLSADRKRGGHLLDCRVAPGAPALEIAVDDLGDLHVETPPGVEIGAARLAQEAVDALERSRPKRAAGPE